MNTLRLRRREGEARYGASTFLRDVLAGLSVALVLIPQALAYAELAGMPPQAGLYAAALPAIAAAFFASSPYLQTGPTAMASLLTLGALSTLATAGSAEYVSLGALLALVVGVVRVVVGALRWGAAAYLLSRTVLLGFTAAAALLILASQIPTALGVRTPEGHVLGQALRVVARPSAWNGAAALLSAVTVAILLGGRRLHRLFPGVLVAAAIGVAVTEYTGYNGEVVGAVGVTLPRLSLEQPWSALPSLLLPGLVIALVGFAEPASIARTYSALDRTHWNANREFVSQGVANLVAGLSGGFPVGGSFGRSGLSRAAGARTRWSGAIAGLVVLLFLPFGAALSSLPRAVLAALVIASVLDLAQPGPIWRLWKLSKPQFAIAVVTFAATLLLAPRIEQGLMIGTLLAVVIHLWRELRLDVEEWEEGGELHLRPMGVLWFGSANTLEERFLDAAVRHPRVRRIVVHLDGLGRMDLTGALSIRAFFEDAREAGLRTALADVPPQSERLVESVLSGRNGEE